MPLYTFNSNTTLGRHPVHFSGIRFVILLLFFTVVLGGGMELFWRTKEHVPTVSDTVSRWGTTVDQVPDHDDNAVVIAGSSRFQLGLNPDVIQREMGASRVVHLARAASSSIPMLEYLAEETEFSGLVLVEFMPSIIFNMQGDGRKSIDVALAQREARPYYTFIEEQLLWYAQNAICINNPSLSWKLFGNGLIRGNWPPPPYARFQKSRYIQADYSRCQDLDKLRQSYMSTNEEPREYDAALMTELVEHIQKPVEMIEQRGGRVVFVMMPSSGPLRSNEEQRFPRENFWEVMKERFKADAVHFSEVEQALAVEFVCPDWSHLDYHDAEKFTASLCNRIK